MFKIYFTVPMVLLLFLCPNTSLLAQSAPPDTLSGTELRTWFVDYWYTGYHTTLGYDGQNGARSYMYNIIDNVNDTVTCVYSGLEVARPYDITRANGTSGMIPINCEHSIPQSFFNYLEPMKSDIHHLYPAYQNWNSTRSNHPFGDIDDASANKWMYLDASQTTIPSSDIDLYSESATGIFEPREDHKGDLARAIFYFYTMYPTEAGAMASLGDMYTFYTWHIQDTITSAEFQRNEEVFQYQGNRNPYIVYPELIKTAWEISHTAPQLYVSADVNTIYLSWDELVIASEYQMFRSLDSISFHALGGMMEADSLSYDDNSALADSSYYYYLRAVYADGDTLTSEVLKSQLQTVPSGTPVASDLIISEYVEGSSYNKAIEIANFTGATVDLSAYTIGKQTNGAGGWAELALNGMLVDGATYVIVNNSSSNTDLTSKADLLSSSSVFSFNGNDPIALIDATASPGMIIDIVGLENGGSANFAKDVTLVRNAVINDPNSNYTTSEWSFNSMDDFSNVGQHLMSPALPVELIEFRGLALANSNQVYWTTGSEDNNELFILEKSKDGIHFEPITEISGAGYSQEVQRYVFEDLNPFSTSYYRLFQVDADNHYTISKTIVVHQLQANLNLSLSPVPAVDYLNISYGATKEERAVANIYDSTGRLIRTYSLQSTEGLNSTSLDLSNISTGIYLFVLQTSEQNIRQPFMKTQ